MGAKVVIGDGKKVDWDTIEEGDYVRQGDTFYTWLGNDPSLFNMNNACEVKNGILVEGEATGHNHELAPEAREAGQAVAYYDKGDDWYRHAQKWFEGDELLQVPLEQQLFVRVLEQGEEVKIVHPDHHAPSLGKVGFWLVTRQYEGLNRAFVED